MGISNTQNHGQDQDQGQPQASSAAAEQAAPLGEGEKAEPPATLTKPGPPVGDVVFDHQPSHAEKEEARQSIDGGR